MAVARSNLHSAAARATAARSAPTWPAIQSARRATRSTFCPMVPSFFWNTTPPARAANSSGVCFWSSRKKKLASARRAASTRSLPWRTTAGSCTTVPAMVTKRLCSRPPSSSMAK